MDTVDELELLEEQSTAWLAELLSKVAYVRIRGSKRQIRAAENELAIAIGRSMAVADLLGRRRLAIQVDDSAQYANLNVPKVPFESAISSILKRWPSIADGWREARDKFLDGAFSLAINVADKVTEKVQGTIERAMRSGVNQIEAENQILDALRTGDPSLTVQRSYAETVYRTNVNTAYTQGLVDEAKSGRYRRRVVGWRFVTAEDDAVRDNHQAAHDFVAHKDDPVWKDLTPPLGYNCRCSLDLVTRREGKRLGIIDNDGNAESWRSAPAGAFPDSGFKGDG